MKITSTYHIPVLLHEAVDSLIIKKGGRYIDATLGGGGHSEEILKRGGLVLGLDCDSEAIEFAEKRLSQFSNRVKLARSNFSHISEIAKDNNFLPVDGVLFDLGVSSHQLETSHRGFSFNLDGNLDMRMDSSLSISAVDLINGLTEKELNELFSKLGGEKYSKRLAAAVCRARRISPIKTTDQLAEIVVRNVPPRGHLDRTHPATRMFQALRIAVNDELNNLRETLPQAVKLIGKKGRLVVISFHSLEDKIVKDFINDQEKMDILIKVTRKPIIPSISEVNNNPRARSAKLRVAEIK